jgi:hypothetical protein
VFDGEIARKIKQLPLGNLHTPDHAFWKETSSGAFSFSSTYQMEIRRAKDRRWGRDWMLGGEDKSGKSCGN